MASQNNKTTANISRSSSSNSSRKSSLIFFFMASLFTLTFFTLTASASPVSVLDVIFGGRAMPEAKHLIYPRTPLKWILMARKFGRNARQNLTIALERDGTNAENRFQLYANYLNKCAGIDQQFMDEGEEENVVLEANQPQASAEAAKFALAIGLDEMTAQLFALPSQQRRLQIGSTCARNELRLQCALGFYSNRMDKLREHIAALKEQDGVFKIMLESECQIAAEELDIQEVEEELAAVDANSLPPAPATTNSVFECIHQKASGPLGDQQCAAPLAAYKASRRQMNQQMQDAFEATISVLERRLERATESGESHKVARALQNGQQFLKRTLVQLSGLESSKCHQFSRLLACLSQNVRQQCGPQPAANLEAMLKVGYLRRERGDVIHEQFMEMGVDTAAECRQAADGL